MANTDLTNSASFEAAAKDLHKVLVTEVTFNAAVNPIAIDGVALLIPVKAGTIVFRAIVDVETANTTTGTFDIGHYTAAGVVVDVDSIVDGASSNATAGLRACVAAIPTTGVKIAADGYIGIIALTGAFDTLKLNLKLVAMQP
jgi:hypothetical protein